MPKDQLAGLLGTTICALWQRARQIGITKPRAAPGMRKYSKPKMLKCDGVTIRPCLKCLREFPSEGKHNRICASCKGIYF